MTFKTLATAALGLFILSPMVWAQTPTQSERPSQPQASQETKPDTKTNGDGVKSKPRSNEEMFDLEKFFEEGARQAQDGASCRKPPEPIA